MLGSLEYRLSVARDDETQTHFYPYRDALNFPPGYFKAATQPTAAQPIAA
jgi:hypothetical protein